MGRKPGKYMALLGVLLAVALACLVLADKLQTDWGRVTVTEGTLEAGEGILAYRLYAPVTTTAENKVPGVLINGSAEAWEPYAIELSRRGAAVLVSDSGMAYNWLAGLDWVDNTRLAMIGCAPESGSETVAPKAIILHYGELLREGTDSWDGAYPNVLLLAAKYDACYGFREGWNSAFQPQSELGLDAWNTTYGSFAEGTARRGELLTTGSRLITHNAKGISATLRWLKAAIGLDLTIEAGSQVATEKELLVLCAALLILFAMLPLMELLLCGGFFAKAVSPLPSGEYLPRGKTWWRGALLVALLGGSSFFFLVLLGYGLPLPKKIFPVAVGNGFLHWYLLLSVFLWLAGVLSRRGARRRGRLLSRMDMGLDLRMWGRTALLAGLMVGMVYGVNVVSREVFSLELGFLRPVFRALSSEGWRQLGIYLPVFFLFYLLAGSRVMAMMRTNSVYLPGARGFFGCWWRNFLVMIGGLLLAALLEYVPLALGYGGEFLLGAACRNGGLLLWFLPQVLLFSILGTYCYRRTGNVTLGAFVMSALADWMMVSSYGMG